MEEGDIVTIPADDDDEESSSSSDDDDDDDGEDLFDIEEL